MHASYNGHVTTVQALIEAKADLNLQDKVFWCHQHYFICLHFNDFQYTVSSFPVYLLQATSWLIALNRRGSQRSWMHLKTDTRLSCRR